LVKNLNSGVIIIMVVEGGYVYETLKYKFERGFWSCGGYYCGFWSCGV
jgi:hypothetical protein